MNNLEKQVQEYPTKYEEGFLDIEIFRLMMNIKALRCGYENRDLKLEEFD